MHYNKKLKIVYAVIFFSLLVLIVFIFQWIKKKYYEEEISTKNKIQNIIEFSESSVLDSFKILEYDKFISNIDSSKAHAEQQKSKTSAQIEDSIFIRLNIDSTINSSTHLKPPMLIDVNDIADSIITVNEKNNQYEGFRNELQTAFIYIASKLNQSLKQVFNQVIPDSTILLKTINKNLKNENNYLSASYVSLGSPDTTLLVSYPVRTVGRFIIIKGENQLLFQALMPQIILGLVVFLSVSGAFFLAVRYYKKQVEFNAQKDSVISNISHELKTPVATTKVILEALTKYDGINDPSRAMRYLEVANWQMERLESMIQQMMDLLLNDHGALILNIKNVNYTLLIQKIIEMIRPIADQEHKKINLNIEDEPIFVMADETHLINAIYNIIDNAIKYGGQNIEIKLIQHQNISELTIIDSGLGIPPKYIETVFDKFFRIPSDDIHNIKGHGLGLSYSKYIFEKLNGHVKVDPNQTNKFIATVPTTNHHE